MSSKCYVLVFFSLLVASAAQARIVACSEGTGAVIALPTGSHTIASGCANFHGGFSITQSNTTLDCQGSTMWGVAAADRGNLGNFEADVESGAITAIGTGILVQSDAAAISNINVSNCNMKAFKRAIGVKHKLSGANWLWSFAQSNSTLSGPVAAYNASQTATNKTNMLNALAVYNWAASPLDNNIRAVTPRDVVFTNVHVDTTSMTGIYVDHHVTDVTFNQVSVTNAAGAGIYLEFGSQNNKIINSTFSNNGREGIAVDSSANNLIQGNQFSNNVNGGVLLYRNCWEYFGDPPLVNSSARGNYFPRTQGSDGNKIYQNTFLGNGQTAHGKNVGVWIASRQSVTANFDGNGCGLYKMSQASNGLYYHEDRAKNVRVVGNLFNGVAEGVLVEDDGARVFGNRIESNVTMPIKIGTVIRTAFFGTPVLGGRASFNLVYQNADQVDLSSVVNVVEQRPEYRLETRVCTTYGRSGRSVTYWTPLCTQEYYNILEDDGDVALFQSAVKLRLPDLYD